jgi:hypothetical protein
MARFFLRRRESQIKRLAATGALPIIPTSGAGLPHIHETIVRSSRRDAGGKFPSALDLNR